MQQRGEGKHCITPHEKLKVRSRTCLYTLSIIIRLGVTHRRLKDHLHRPRRRFFGNKDLNTPSTTQHNNTTSLTKGPTTPSLFNEDSSTSTTLHPSAKDLSTPSTSTTQRQQRLIYIDNTTTQHNNTAPLTKGPSTPSTYVEDSSTSSTQRHYTHH